MKRTISALAVSALMVGALTSCGSASNDAAEAAFEECDKPDAEIRPLVIKGSEVTIAITGDLARAASGTDDEIKGMADGDIPETSGLSGVGVLLATVAAATCLAEATGFPGSHDQLKDGDEWDGWSYSERKGVGSEAEMTFTADF